MTMEKEFLFLTLYHTILTFNRDCIYRIPAFNDHGKRIFFLTLYHTILTFNRDCIYRIPAFNDHGKRIFVFNPLPHNPDF